MTYNLTNSESASLLPANRRSGMIQTEVDSYSISRLIRGLMASDGSPRRGIEFDASCETYRNIFDKEPEPASSHRAAIPVEWLERDLHVAVPGAGGFLTQTSNVGFINMLRARSVVLRMGAIRIPGLRDDTTLSKQTGTAATQWLVNEVTAPSEAQQSFGQIIMTPKIVTAYTELSRSMIKQASPMADIIIERDLASGVALAMDAAAIAGAGASGEPLGILQATGIHTASGTDLDYAAILECQSDVLTSNALIDLNTIGYAAPTAVASTLMQRVKFTGTDSQLWEGAMADGSVAGHRAMSSQQVPVATMIFGDWSQLVIGEWGSLEIEVNPYANFRAGIVGIRAILSIDIALRHTESFCAITSIT